MLHKNRYREWLPYLNLEGQESQQFYKSWQSVIKIVQCSNYMNIKHVAYMFDISHLVLN
jgi:hypothetical protein